LYVVLFSFTTPVPIGVLSALMFGVSKTQIQTPCSASTAPWPV
jgi:hypothetical protein